MINKAVNYKTEDFVPVAMVGAAPVGIVTRPDFPANSIDEMIELVKKSPGKFSIGSAGIGSFGHVMSEVIKARTGTFMVHIPYRGGAQIISDLISGQIDFAVTTLATAAAMISSKRVKVLGVSSKERVPLVKDVGTFGESQALKGVDMLVWATLFAPPGTPDAVVQKMNQAIVQVNALPSMKALVLKLGSELPPSLTPAQTKDYLKAQRELYQVAASRIQPE
jgi:tripartite-type tricarboxylate transporter receptor subunit TctC